MKAVIFNIQKFSIHDGPGIRTTVFFKGCHLKCKWCCNPESQSSVCNVDKEGALYGREYEVEEVVAEILKDKAFYDMSGGGATLSGGEVLLQADFARKLAERLHEEKVSVAIETSLAVPQEIREKMVDIVDYWIVDLKMHDEGKHLLWTGKGNDLVKTNLRNLIDRGSDVVVRIPVIPGFNDSLKDAGDFGMTLRGLGVSRVELLPFHQFGERKYDLLGMDYSMKGVPSLRSDDLGEYARIISDCGNVNRTGIQTGIDVLIGG